MWKSLFEQILIMQLLIIEEIFVGSRGGKRRRVQRICLKPVDDEGIISMKVAEHSISGFSQTKLMRADIHCVYIFDETVIL